MYNLILVDDEEFALNKMGSAFKWGELGYKLTGLFTDPRKAIEHLNNHHVDVVMTDIKMPYMDGIELSEYIYNNFPKIKIVILSAYQDFVYAQKAIQFGVFNYLLKPMQFNDFLKTFNSIKMILDEDDKNNEEAKYLVKKQLFFDVFMGVLKRENDILNRFNAVGIDNESAINTVAIAKITLNNLDSFLKDCWKYGEDRLLIAVEQILNETSNDFQYDVLLRNEETIDILVSTNKKMNLNEFTELFNKSFMSQKSLLIETIELNSQLVNLSLYNSIIELCNSYSRGKFESCSNECANKYSEVFLFYINSGDVEAVENLILNYFKEFQDDNHKRFIDSSVELLNIIYNKLGLSQENVNKEIFSKTDDIKTLNKELRKYILDIVLDIRNNGSEHMKSFVKKAKEYIDEHFAEDISLESVSNYVYVTPKYFSVVFKKNTGFTFTDYLINKRIQQAIKYLADPQYKIYELGRLVGYKSTRYFYRLFKQYTGYTPSEYRDKM